MDLRLGGSMNQRKNTSQWLVVIFCIGFLILNYPLLSLYGNAQTVAGIPIFYIALFLAWAILIGCVALVIERQGK